MRALTVTAVEDKSAIDLAEAGQRLEKGWRENDFTIIPEAECKVGDIVDVLSVRAAITVSEYWNWIYISFYDSSLRVDYWYLLTTGTWPWLLPVPMFRDTRGKTNGQLHCTNKQMCDLVDLPPA